MPIEAVTAPRDAGLYTGAPVRAPKQSMDGEVFMQLLVTQLQNQDPSSPMDTNEMIAQTTQLAMMEKLNQLATNAEENFSLQMRSAAAALIGREVSYTGADGQSATGLATAVSYAGQVPTVTVGGQPISLDAVTGIVAAGAS
ncbi:flagellar hook capping protein [Pseudarthrobacter phenanthrenivorans]|uniref:flagellar hook assembly protein FlgD n=1 Tax=Pseudarthrobacter phenanthrenivorans TaxID=361575 RepID=UPI00112B7003|nr:flagellar hook capping FlgD N-terminal domain-containing protein [Pseudarthrobacter phenanthrenivorans]TPV52571.1 flagellar hook capping protein [Pseudarthrobacter phenanthrenivorans]